MDVRRFRDELKRARLGKLSALRQGPKIGRPTLSDLTAARGQTPVNSQTIKHIEDGKTHDPGIRTVARLLEALGVKLSDFFAEVERTASVGLQTDKRVSNTAASTHPLYEASHGASVRSAASVALSESQLHELTLDIERRLRERGLVDRVEHPPTSRGQQSGTRRSHRKRS